MANGGWYGTMEEWDRIETPLRRVDSVLDDFAVHHGLVVTRNQKEWPERSMRWGHDPSNLIQLYLADESKLTWHLWICSSQDRGLQRFWKRERVIDGQSLELFEGGLRGLLAECHKRLTAWSENPSGFEFAGPIEPLH